MPTAVISQDATELDFRWHEGDPLSLAFVVNAVDLAGSYTQQIRRTAGAADVLLTLTWTATEVTDYDILDVTGAVVSTVTGTLFTTSLAAASNTLLGGFQYVHDIQQSGGVTRFKGKVSVTAQVTR